MEVLYETKNFKHTTNMSLSARTQAEGFNGAAMSRGH
jgi:hypothetical protein